MKKNLFITFSLFIVIFAIMGIINKVNAANVSIAFSDTVDPYLAAGRQANLPKPDESGNPWC